MLIEWTTESRRAPSVVEPVAVSGDDEERVVDADADADHGGDLGRERGHVEQVGEQLDDRQSDADAGERGDDRQAHGQERTEGDEEDHDRGQDADCLAGGHGLFDEHRPAELDLHGVVARGLDDGPHVRGFIEVDIVGPLVELDLGVGDGLGGGDEALGAGVVVERGRHRGDVGLLGQLVEHGLHDGQHLGTGRRRTVLDPPHDLAGVTGPVEVLTQDVERLGGVAAGEIEGLQQGAARGLAGDAEPDKRDHPQEEDERRRS